MKRLLGWWMTHTLQCSFKLPQKFRILMFAILKILSFAQGEHVSEIIWLLDCNGLVNDWRGRRLCFEPLFLPTITSSTAPTCKVKDISLPIYIGAKSSQNKKNHGNWPKFSKHLVQKKFNTNLIVSNHI